MEAYLNMAMFDSVDHRFSEILFLHVVFSPINSLTFVYYIGQCLTLTLSETSEFF